MTDISLNTNAVTPAYAGAAGSPPLSNEALMVYLQGRLQSVDGQINTLFEKQQKIERIRRDINVIQGELQKLENDTTVKGKQQIENDQGETLGEEALAGRIEDAIADIEEVDPRLGERMRRDLNETGQILKGGDGKYLTSEVENTTNYLNSLNKELEASAQLDMIQLQSLMSARQTAIQLATNMVSAFNESTKAIAGNVGR